MNKRNQYYLTALVLVVTFLVFLPALRNDFVNWDDFDYAYDNYHIRSLSWDFLAWAFTDTSHAGFWYPLVWISHALDYAIWGLNPFGHHLTSTILHAVNAFLVTLLIIRLLEAYYAAVKCPVPAGGRETAPSRSRSDRTILITAGVTGLLFGIHPLHVESVAWVSERKDLLCAFFFLLSLIAYIDYARFPKMTPVQRGMWACFSDKRYNLSLVLFMLALSCKAMAVTLPAVLLVLDWHPLGRWSDRHAFIRSCAEKAPFALFSLIITLVSLAGQKAFGALGQMESVGIGTRMLVSGKALMLYLGKMVVPVDLVPFYPYPINVSAAPFSYLVAMALAGLVTAICLYLANTQRWWLSVWGYYVVTVLPVIGIVPIGTHFMADRYTYLPSLGPFLVAGLAAGWIWAKVSLKQYGLAGKGAALAAALSIVIVLSVLTIEQIGVWKNSIVFWNYVIEKEGDRVPVAYNNRGIALSNAGQLDRALADHTKAILLKPDYPDYYSNRGVVYRRTGQDRKALDDFDKAIAIDPRYADAYVNRGMLFKDEGQMKKALEDFTTAITLHTRREQAYYYRGRILQEQGQTGQAIEDFSAALVLNPNHAEAYNDRGLLFAQTGRLAQALSDFDSAIRINPIGVEAFNNRALVFEEMGRFSEAILDYDRAIKVMPDDYLSYSNRGIVYGKMNRIDEAIADHSKAIQLKPGFSQAYFERGSLYARTGHEAAAIKDFQAACRLGNADGCIAARKRGQQ